MKWISRRWPPFHSRIQPEYTHTSRVALWNPNLFALFEIAAPTLEVGSIQVSGSGHILMHAALKMLIGGHANSHLHSCP